MLKKKNKKASVAIYITFFITAIIIVLIAAVLAPLGTRINSEFYVIGERLMLDSNSSVQNIVDNEVRQSVTDTIGAALEAEENNIEVNANLFQYSWILVLGLTALVMFLVTRRIVEVSGNAGFL